MGKNRKTKGNNNTLSDCRETEHEDSATLLSGLSNGASKRVNFGNSRYADVAFQHPIPTDVFQILQK
jgi:hypothetical protein